MHEASLARGILAAVLERVGSQPIRVVRVHGWLAETEALDATSIQLHFDAAAEGTAADGAELALRLTHVEARCLACDTRYPPEHHLTLCPACGSVDGELLGETGLGVDRIDVADP